MTAAIPRPQDIPNKALYTVPEAMVLLSFSRSTIYELMRSGRLLAVREGTATRIPAEAIAAYVALLVSEAKAA